MSLKTKAFFLITCVSFCMSATKCEEPQPEPRQLKKNVRLMSLGAASYLDNSGFSFSETAQSQWSGVLFETNHFFERNVYPTVDSAVVDQQYYQLSSAASDRVKKYFPMAKSAEIALSRESGCLISRPQHFLAGKINALEAYSGTKFVLGFNQSVGANIPVSGSFEINKMRMDASFHAFDPWTQQAVASKNVEEFKKDYAFKFGIDLGIFHIGPEFYRSSGMAETTLKTLRTGVKELAQKLLSTPGEDWQSRVVYSRDNYILILGGVELGIKKGDQFKVFNQTHNWTGQACGDSSILVGSVVVSDRENPWIVEVVGDDDKMFTLAKVLNPKENDSIDTGALVKIHQLVQPQPVAAKK